MVRFRKTNRKFFDEAEKVFQREKGKIMKAILNADVQHVGSTSIPSALTKGDLDIQVRVERKDFPDAERRLSQFYQYNTGNPPTKTFLSFKDPHAKIPLGVQLTVIGSDADDFMILRDLLRSNPNYKKQYDVLKKQFNGKSMSEYRRAKSKFFDTLRRTLEFKRLKHSISNR